MSKSSFLPDEPRLRPDGDGSSGGVPATKASVVPSKPAHLAKKHRQSHASAGRHECESAPWHHTRHTLASPRLGRCALLPECRAAGGAWGGMAQSEMDDVAYRRAPSHLRRTRSRAVSAACRRAAAPRRAERTLWAAAQGRSPPGCSKSTRARGPANPSDPDRRHTRRASSARARWVMRWKEMGPRALVASIRVAALSAIIWLTNESASSAADARHELD